MILRSRGGNIKKLNPKGVNLKSVERVNIKRVESVNLKSVEKLEDLEISREENEKLKDKYQTLTGSFDNMKEFIETNYEGSEVVSSEYTKMCEDVLNLYKKNTGKK